MGNEYESVLTFLGEIITTMVGRLVKEKIGAYVTRSKQNRIDINEEGRSTYPNSYRSIGMPLIRAPASRIIANSAREILVNRDGRVGEQVNTINTPNTSLDNSSDWSPHIQVELKNNYYHSLIDTGATINVITKRVVSEMNLPIENHFIQYITANGNVTTTEGRITHSLKIMNKNYKITFEIIPECKHDIILGMPAIKQKKRNFYVSNNVTIPPRACTIFHAKVAPNRNIESNIILDLHSYWKNVDNLLTFEQVGKIHDGIIPIVLINAGRNPVDLKKDTHIGHVHTIQEINEDTLLVTSEEVIPDDADWEETLLPYPSQTDPIDYDSFIELINLSESILTEKGKQKLLEICWKHKTAFYEYDGKPGLYSGKQSLNIKLKTDKIPTRINHLE
uniref:Peptidase A2 domain-containing protein n=1 Tax=Strongyloides venezuelensis TaxID=75913 RepID=A0A0K0FTF4_STRVS